jgi:hypothetical protein
MTRDDASQTTRLNRVVSAAWVGFIIVVGTFLGISSFQLRRDLDQTHKDLAAIQSRLQESQENYRILSNEIEKVSATFGLNERQLTDILNSLKSQYVVINGQRMDLGTAIANLANAIKLNNGEVTFADIHARTIHVDYNVDGPDVPGITVSSATKGNVYIDDRHAPDNRPAVTVDEPGYDNKLFDSFGLEVNDSQAKKTIGFLHRDDADGTVISNGRNYKFQFNSNGDIAVYDLRTNDMVTLIPVGQGRR